METSQGLVRFGVHRQQSYRSTGGSVETVVGASRVMVGYLSNAVSSF